MKQYIWDVILRQYNDDKQYMIIHASSYIFPVHTNLLIHRNILIMEPFRSHANRRLISDVVCCA